VTLQDWVLGGIPPDPDQRDLTQCCFKPPGGSRCPATSDREPLAVAAAAGKLRVFCLYHCNRLQHLSAGGML